jgi:uncharacterized protein (UPF0332 family)
MARAANKDERRVLNLVRNHGEFKETLSQLAMSRDLPALKSHVDAVVKCWIQLGREHLADANAALASTRNRATLSRAYYAAYSSSKAVRYLVRGSVSLRGDDHGKAAAELPDDFPNVNSWTVDVAEMYANRLRADYDAFSDTPAEFSMTPQDAVAKAAAFVDDCVTYLAKRGVVV